jgi:hypothetical protein
MQVAKDVPLKLLWASRIILNVVALVRSRVHKHPALAYPTQIFLAPCTFMPAVAVPCVLASTGLYLIADAAFKSNANDEQVAEEFDLAQVSVLNFLLDVPGFVCGTYDRYLASGCCASSQLHCGLMCGGRFQCSTSLRPSRWL